MPNPSSRILEQVPLHYREYAQGYITFLQKYYDWLYRKSGLSDDEIARLRNDTSWIPDTHKSLDRSIIDIAAKQSPGAEAANIAEAALLEERHEYFVTSDDEYLEFGDGAILEVSSVNEEFLNSWFNAMGTLRINRDKVEGTIDEVLMVSLLKHLHGIKGTEKSIKLFFNLYFNEDVELYYPKFDIAIIDDNWVPDTHGVVRDDSYYNEYSYVIRVHEDLNTYEELFNRVFLKNIHPAGFKVFLEKI